MNLPRLQSLPAKRSRNSHPCRTVDTEATTMAKSMFLQRAVLQIIGILGRKARHGTVLLLGIALIAVFPQSVSASPATEEFGQMSQQQEQQQRDEQQRQQQEQQQRDQQARDQQQRDEQQRQQQEQQRQQQEQQQREQQTRDQQQRDEQQRQQQQQQEQQRQQQEQQRQQQEQQTRDQQQREQQQRDQQARDQQLREQQQRTQQLQVSNTNSVDSQPVVKPPVSDVKHAIPEPPTSGIERKINPPTPVANPTAVKEREPSPIEPDLRHRVLCGNEPCKQPAAPPVEPDLRHRVCTNGPCQPCPPGQLTGKEGFCAPPPAAKVVPVQTCFAGQVWDGIQCVAAGAPQCHAGQTEFAGTCRTDCATSTGGAQNLIAQLRSARQRKDNACLQNSTGKECQDAEQQYNMMLIEYRNYLGGVPAECRGGLPDPIAI
jgi:hypothetical protein